MPLLTLYFLEISWIGVFGRDNLPKFEKAVPGFSTDDPDSYLFWINVALLFVKDFYSSQLS
jgi:hypothetical protein